MYCQKMVVQSVSVDYLGKMMMMMTLTTQFFLVPLIVLNAAQQMTGQEMV